MSEKIRIGIPRGLFYYSYYPFFLKFFTDLGAEVIVSSKTSKITVEKGLSASSNELCIPIKVLYGHVLELKDKTDYIFLPYVISSSKGTYYCPKIIGSPDIIKANIPGLNLLSIDVDMDRFYKSLLSSTYEVGIKLGVSPMKILAAYKSARLYQIKFNKYISQGVLFDEALSIIDLADSRLKVRALLEPKKDLTIAIIGHPYVINDSYISFDIVKKLRSRGVFIVTSEKLTDAEVNNHIKGIESRPHWSLGSRVLASAICYSMDKKVDGIIYLTPFSCSSDSLLKEYMDANIHTKKPLMTLIVDEHSSDAGMITRLEAYLDMIENHKSHASNISIHGILNELSVE